MLMTLQLAAKVVELEEYKGLLAERATLKKVDFLSRLVENTPFETEAELESWVKKTEGDIRRKQRKDMGEGPEPDEEPTFPLVDRPDAELTEEEVKEKRKQRLMKAGWEARVKAREEKKRERERQVRTLSIIWADCDVCVGRRETARRAGTGDGYWRLVVEAERGARKCHFAYTRT